MDKRKDEPMRRRKDRDIHKVKDEWERTFDAIQDIITILDSERRIVRANKAAFKLFEIKESEIIGKKCYEVFHDKNEKCTDCHLWKDNDARTTHSHITYNEKYNKIFNLESAPIFNESGEVTHYVNTSRDVTRQKEDEAQSNLLSHAIEQASEVIVITDEKGNVEYVNPAFSTMTGYSRREVLGQNPRLLKSGEHDTMFYKNMWGTLMQKKVWSGNIVNRKKDGTLFHEDVTISPVMDVDHNITNFIAVKRDITKEDLLEKKLQQAMKMEAIGTLAGGIAHDFNNILSAMIGYCQIAKGRLSSADPAQGDIEQVLQAGDRAVDLVKQILTFSRKGEQEGFQTFKIQVLIKEVLRLMRSSLPSTIELDYNIDYNCGSIFADAGQIHQLLMNLFTNAKQAIGGSYGKITVELSESTVHKKDFPRNRPLRLTGPYLHLQISDSGCGMDAHTMERIFDPFFSTKSKDHGTGLGLAVVHGIVTNHGGEINASSEVGQGTTFNVYFPVIQSTKVKEKEPTKQLFRGSERIMVVDDEGVVGRVVRNMLTKMGYKVTLFSSSLEAVSDFRRNPQNYDLVFTDMTMPDMTGAELAKEVLALRPELPVILSTGYSEIIDKDKAARIGIRKFMLKPIKRRHLSKVVREVLDHG